MNPNEKLIQEFYVAFQQKNYRKMQECYHEKATFSDEVFQNLSALEVKAMWHMLIERGKDMVLDFNAISANENQGKAHWEADYTFSASKRKVHNSIDAAFEFRDGKIYRHQDTFDFWRWAGMALGPAGKVLGWTTYLRNKVRKTAREGLQKFISTHPEYQS